MTILTVLEMPDPRLRKQAQPIKKIDKSIKTLAADMLETMYAENGIGLAATQVDVQQRIVTIDISEERNEPHVFINPKIIARTGTQDSYEGCLSVPELTATITRSNRIQVEALTLKGKKITMELEGLFSRCMQHEIDHLNGVLFIDHVPEAERERLIALYEEKRKTDVTACLS